MNPKKILTRAAGTVTLAVVLVGCGTTPTTDAMPELQPVPTMSAEDIAEATEMWKIDTASDTPFHDDEDADTTVAQVQEVPIETTATAPLPVTTTPEVEPVLQLPEDVQLTTTPEVPVPATTTWQAPAEPEVETTPDYIEVIWDEGQPTHWENGGLVVGTYSDALATCQDGRFMDESEGQDCIDAAVEWGKDTGQDMNTGPTTLPKRD